MSKSQARLRDQGKKQPPVQAPVVVTHEIIPGKFSENDWYDIIKQTALNECKSIALTIPLCIYFQDSAART